jgi:DNA-directed RNA polymerase specialized sigma24 family protein
MERDERHRLTGYTPVDAIEVAERAEAVNKAVESLPPRLGEIAKLLMHHSQAEVARILGVSETAIDRARKQIATHFIEIGIENFF